MNRRIVPTLLLCAALAPFAPCAPGGAATAPSAAANDSSPDLFWSEGSDSATPAPVSGSALVAECLSRLPAEQFAMSGTITMRRPRGVAESTCGFSVRIHWGAPQPVAVYSIFDGKTGALLETVTARYTSADSQPTLARTVGPAETPADPPQWNDRIQNSDVTWLDVSMAFLWWRDPALAGTQTVKGRLCDIVDLYPPMPVPDCAKMRVWMDRDVKLMLRAEEYNAEGKSNRRLWVRSVKKFDGRWMVRDIEVESAGTRMRTRVHVDDVLPAPDVSAAAPEPDAAAPTAASEAPAAPAEPSAEASGQ